MHARIPDGVRAGLAVACAVARAGDVTAATVIRGSMRLALRELGDEAAGPLVAGCFDAATAARSAAGRERIGRCRETATEATAPTTIDGVEAVELARRLARHWVRPVDAIAWQVGVLLAAQSARVPVVIAPEDSQQGFLPRDENGMLSAGMVAGATELAWLRLAAARQMAAMRAGAATETGTTVNGKAAVK